MKTELVLEKLQRLIITAEDAGLRIRVEPLPSGHSYNVGTWTDMSTPDAASCGQESNDLGKLTPNK